MTDPDGQPLLERFFRGAGSYFGRFLRLLVIFSATLGLGVGAVSGVLTAATRPLREGGSEQVAFWTGIAVQACIWLVAAFFLLAHDYARVSLVDGRARGTFRAWFRAMLFVVRRTPGVATIGLLAAIGVCAAMAAGTAFDAWYGGRSWLLIVGEALVLQLVLLARTAVRVGQLSAEAAYWRGLRPAAVPAMPAESDVAVPAPQALPPEVAPVQAEAAGVPAASPETERSDKQE